jgi:hypothetical protein
MFFIFAVMCGAGSFSLETSLALVLCRCRQVIARVAAPCSIVVILLVESLQKWTRTTSQSQLYVQ